MATLERFDFEGVEAVRLGLSNRVNTASFIYRIDGTLVDTGPANQWRYLRGFLMERDVDKVLLTHHHEDHGGNAGRIVSKTQAQVFVHEAGLTACEKGFHVPIYRRLVWGKPKRFKATKLPEHIEAGPLSLRPIHCPGHAPDHVCFLEKRRGWLFSGDAYISCAPRFLRADENPNLEIQSLQYLMSLHFDTLFCAHRGVILGGYEAMQKKLTYLVSLREQVRHYLLTGDSTKEITRRLLGKEEWVSTFSSGEFSKHNFVKAFARSIRSEKFNESELD